MSSSHSKHGVSRPPPNKLNLTNDGLVMHSGTEGENLMQIPDVSNMITRDDSRGEKLYVKMKTRRLS